MKKTILFIVLLFCANSLVCAQNAPPCADGQVLTWNAASSNWKCATGSAGTPGGSSGNVQVNNAGALGALTGSTFSGSSLGIGGAVDGSALLTLISTSKGFLAPRMTTVQRDAITSPTQGLTIHNTTTGQLNAFTGSTSGNRWQAVLTDYLNGTNIRVGNNDLNYAPSVYWRFIGDGSLLNGGFSTQTGQALEYTAPHGWNFNGSKLTTIGSQILMTSRGQGQRLARAGTLTALGMGDAIIADETLNFYGGLNAGGDEGQFLHRYIVEQGTTIATGSVASVPAQATINTTTTQAITRNVAAQTVTVADSTGVTAGQWVILDQTSPAGATETTMEAVRITAVGGGTITGIFRASHTSGATVKAATVLNLSGSTQFFGEGRYVLNTAQPSYSTGQAVATNPSISVNITGSGTTWANNMVGGNSDTVGMISFDADTVTASPFSAENPLRSWYPIASVVNGTSLNIWRRDAVGIAPYDGKATTLGGYIVRPAAKIMAFESYDSNTGIVVLENNPFTWTVGDTVECPVSTSGEVSGSIYRAYAYTPGGTYRDIISIGNLGIQDFDYGLRIYSPSYPTTGGFTAGASIQGIDTGVAVSTLSATGTAIGIGSLGGTRGSKIQWDGGTYVDTLGAGNGFKLQAGIGTTNGVHRWQLDPDASGAYLSDWTGRLELKNFNNANETYLGLSGINTNKWRVGPQFISGARYFTITNTDAGDGPISNDLFTLNQSGTLRLGKPSVATGTLTLNNASGTTTTSFSAGNAAASLNYILPTASPTAGQVWSASAPSGANVTTSWVTPNAMLSKAGEPTTSDIAAGTWAVYKNTSSGEVKLWVNDGGVMRSVALP